MRGVATRAATSATVRLSAKRVAGPTILIILSQSAGQEASRAAATQLL